MFQGLSARVTKKWISNGTITEADEDIYQYGVRQGLIALLNLITTLILGWFFECIFESIIFMIAYLPLRSFAGGYHAKTAGRCYMFSIIMMIIILWVMEHMRYAILLCGCLTLLAGIIIYILAPVEDRNKPLDCMEQKVYRKRTHRILIVDMLIAFTALLFSWERIAICMTLALCVVAMMLLVGLLRNVTFSWMLET